VEGLAVQKFGLFDSTHKAPLQEYEGDYMTHQGEYVTIWAHPKNPQQTGRQVAAIRLEKGFSVREINPAMSHAV
jgi:hypothetical protein